MDTNSEQYRLRHILGRLAAAHDEASDAATEARQRLDAAIREATGAELSTREISDIVGLSHMTVARIAHRRDGD